MQEVQERHLWQLEINELLRNKFKTVFIKKKYSSQNDEYNLLKKRGKIISSKKRTAALKNSRKKL